MASSCNHDHYLYTIHFNKVLKMVQPNTRCDVMKNKQRVTENKKRTTKVAGKKCYLFHSSQTHCIFVQLVSQTIQASSATASRNFNVHLATIEDVGLQHVAEQDYILPKGLVSFVYDGFISAAILQHARQLIEPGATAVN